MEARAPRYILDRSIEFGLVQVADFIYQPLTAAKAVGVFRVKRVSCGKITCELAF